MSLRSMYGKAVALAAALLLAGCATGYGGGNREGAVDYIDAQRRMIVLTRGGYSGSRETVYYDGNTVVDYGGRTYRPEQLERGDVISIQGRRLNDGWLAERIRVEVDVRSR